MGPVEGSAIPLLQPHRPAAEAVPPAPTLGGDAVTSAGKSFLDLVTEAAKMGHHANDMAKDIAEGRSDDIHGTMIEMSKASIETRLAVNVKDKIIDAFYEIWRMSV
jgi:flagellar hook-basal body complex protein FliE